MLQPKEIKEYFIKKGKALNDEFGWTGEFRLSAKDILDFVMDMDNTNLHLKIIRLTEQLLKFSLRDAAKEKPEGEALLVTKSKTFIIGDWYKGAWRTHRSQWINKELVSAFKEDEITYWMPLPYWLIELPDV